MHNILWNPRNSNTWLKPCVQTTSSGFGICSCMKEKTKIEDPYGMYIYIVKDISSRNAVLSKHVDHLEL